jgi:virulence-associated protein VagC
MPEPKYAKILNDGDTQIVLLPDEFCLPEGSVLISRVGDGILLESVPFDLDDSFVDIE